MTEFFALSRLFWLVAAPSNVMLFLALAGLVLVLTRWRKAGVLVLVLALGAQVLTGFGPTGNYLVSPLEERFAPFVPDDRPVDGIILLGGAEVDDVAAARHMPAVNDAAERIIVFADLARRYPQARLIFTGLVDSTTGSGSLADSAMGEVLRAVGVDLDRVTFEGEARNTAENALFTKKVMVPAPGSRWLLVTSAFHMPRAIGCFRAADFPVVAVPVDFRTVSPNALSGLFRRVAQGQDLTDLATKEWIGLLVYYLTGRIPSLFPAP